MSDNWQVGDLAVCVNDSFARVCSTDPVIGDIRKVCLVDVADYDTVAFGCEFGEILLDFVGNNSGHIFCASSFRKIKPDTEPCEEEFTTLIKRMKPAKVKA